MLRKSRRKWGESGGKAGNLIRTIGCVTGPGVLVYHSCSDGLMSTAFLARSHPPWYIIATAAAAYQTFLLTVSSIWFSQYFRFMYLPICYNSGESESEYFHFNFNLINVPIFKNGEYDKWNVIGRISRHRTVAIERLPQQFAKLYKKFHNTPGVLNQIILRPLFLDILLCRVFLVMPLGNFLIVLQTSPGKSRTLFVWIKTECVKSNVC